MDFTVSAFGSVGAGFMRSLAVNRRGELWVWGRDVEETLGEGGTKDRPIPSKVETLASVKEVGAGERHTVALRDDQTVWSFGAGDRGQLGNGTNSESTIPLRVIGLSGVTAIAVGKDHALALLSDQTVRAWGRNDSGQLGDGSFEDRSSPVSVKGLTDVIAVAAGASHSLALRKDGRVFAWGDNAHGQLGNSSLGPSPLPVHVRNVTGAVSVASGPAAHHSFALTRRGRVLGWGRNESGQLGNGQTTDLDLPIELQAFSGVSRIAAGESHSVAVTNDGRTWVWGDNSHGQLGRAGAPALTPIMLPSIADVVRVAAGQNRNVTLTRDGSIFTWGDGQDGQLADDMSIAPLRLSEAGFLWKAGTPVLNPPSGTYNREQSVFLSSATVGAAIHYTTNGAEPTPADAVLPSNSFVQVAESVTLKARAFAPGLAPSDTVAATYLFKVATPTLNPPPGAYRGVQGVELASTSAGAAVHYTLDGSEPRPASPCARLISVHETLVLRARAFRAGWEASDTVSADYVIQATGAIAVGDSHSLMLDLNQTVWAWGSNSVGQLGDGSMTSRTSPQPVMALPDVVAIAAGGAHSLALRKDGKVLGWGGNQYGQTGAGNPSPTKTPALINGLSNIVAIDGGGWHSLALASDGTVWALGRNDNGQLGVGDQLPRTGPVQVSSLSDVIEISAGATHNLALTANGMIWAWGSNANGRLGDGTTITRPSPVPVASLSEVRAISAGALHSLAVRRDGSAWAWGSNGSGRLGDGTRTDRKTPVPVVDLSRVESVSAGESHSLATTEDGGVFAWGDNANGRLGDGTTTDRDRPTPIPAVTGFSIQVAAGAGHSLALDADGVVWSWGGNASGQLGDLSNEDRHTPLLVAGVYGKITPPAFDPAAGIYAQPLSVAVTCQPGDSVVHYTTDGIEVTEIDAAIAQGGTVRVTRSLNLKARAWRVGWTPSDPVSALYQIQLGTLAAPRIDPPGGSYREPVAVTITSPPLDATLRYTLDGSEPDFRSPVYRSPFTVATATTVKARAFQSDWTASGSTTAIFRFDTEAVATPEIRPGGGSYSAVLRVSVRTETPDAVIHFTVDGRDPTESDPAIASGDSIRVDRAMRLKARAFKEGLSSKVRSADFWITGAVAAGHNHSMAIQSDGSLFTWGSNGYGQLGDGTNQRKLLPQKVPGIVNVVAIAGGYLHTLALTSDGRVWAFGNNNWGQLGKGSPGDSLVPVRVVGLSDVIAIAAGGDHSLALTDEGVVWAWGRDASGELGDGDPNGRSKFTPQPVPGLSGITQIAAGFRHSLALKTDGTETGTLFSFGENSDGQLGDGTKTGRRTPMPGISDVLAIGAGHYHTLVVMGDGSVEAFGRNTNGQVNSDPDTTVEKPRRVPVLSSARKVAGGASFSLALLSERTLWAWGHNGSGQLGDPGTAPVSRPLPKRLAALTEVIDASPGQQHALALTRDGQVWSWGSNTSGAIGDGTIGGNRKRPFAVSLDLADTSWLTADLDGDGLSGEDEMAYGSDPLNPDTNADGILDGAAVASGRSPTDPDMDKDGLLNGRERELGTDPFRPDTDGDGVSDGVDAFPLDSSRQEAPAPDPNDTTPPEIVLLEPTNATLVSSGTKKR